MSAKDIIIDALATNPCRALLSSLERRPIGLSLLNRISYPRCVFSSFAEAWDAAKRVTYAGHDHPDYLEFQAGLAGALRPSDYAVLYWFKRINANPLRVLDFAGSVGNIYYSYASHLRQFTDEMEWVVFDLPNVVEAGKRFAAERGEKQLHFASSLEGLQGSFIVYVSSAFHYWEKSVAEFVASLPSQSEYIIVNRVPMTVSQPTFVTVQYKKTFAVPCMVRNRNELISEFAAQDYTLLDSWQAPELCLRMPLFPLHSISEYSGFCFRRQSARQQCDPLQAVHAA
jgi:putative methyltransferase (TIGR04325 family)